MLAPAVTAIKARVAANFSAMPLRWSNDDWPNNSNPQNTGIPFIEAEIIGGYNALVGFSSPGNRLFCHPGIIRFYICVPELSGMDLAEATADTLSGFMERVGFVAPADPQIVRTQDFSVNQGVASIESGNYAVLQCSCPFELYYLR